MGFVAASRLGSTLPIYPAIWLGGAPIFGSKRARLFIGITNRSEIAFDSHGVRISRQDFAFCFPDQAVDWPIRQLFEVLLILL